MFKTVLLNTLKWLALFLTIEIWRLQTRNLPPLKARMIRLLRTVLLSVKRFSDDNCQLHASALTFFSLISIVPVLAMTFGIAQGFGFEKMLENLLYEKFPGQEGVLSQGIEFAHNLLENTRGGALAGIGLVGLVWSVIKVLGNIESSFNDIWNVQKSRPLIRKFTDYLSIMLICPILFILSNSLTIFIKTEIDIIVHKFTVLGFFSPIFSGTLKLAPFFLIWMLFTALYMFMTNTRVNFKSAFLAGIIAGTAFQLLQWGLIAFQVGVARNNAIYGSFAAVPIFLIWLQMSWLILLAGSEVAFAHQHIHEYEFEPDTRRISRGFRDKLTILITHFISEKFKNGETPLGASTISSRTGIPIRLTQRILDQLVYGGILTKTREDNQGELVYQPARDISQFTIKFVLDAISNHGTDAIPIPETRELKAISNYLDKISDLVETSDANRLLNDI